MVSVETIREQFDELGIEPSDDIINKCIEICINNDINDPVEFVEQWMAYSVSKLGGAEPTVAYLNEMEAHEYTSKTARKVKASSLTGAGLGNIASPRLDSKVSKITTYRNVDSTEQDVLEMYGCITPKMFTTKHPRGEDRLEGMAGSSLPNGRTVDLEKAVPSCFSTCLSEGERVATQRKPCGVDNLITRCALELDVGQPSTESVDPPALIASSDQKPEVAFFLVDETQTSNAKKPTSRLQHNKNTPECIRGGGSAFTTVTYSPLSTASKKVDPELPSKAGQVVYTYGNAQLLKQINWLPSGTSSGDDAGGGGGDDEAHKSAGIVRRTAGGTNVSFQAALFVNDGSKYMFDSSYDRVMILSDRIYEIGNAICSRLMVAEQNTNGNGTEASGLLKAADESSSNNAVQGDSSTTPIDGAKQMEGQGVESEKVPMDHEDDEATNATWFEKVQVCHVDFPSSESIRVLGRIVVEPSSTTVTGGGAPKRTSDRLSIVDFDENTLRQTKLDLSRVAGPGWSLFPGQTVLLEGINPRATLFSVQRIHHERTLTLPRTPFDLERPVTMVIASAPFTDRDDLLYEKLTGLLQSCSEEPPDVLLLTGPFADASCQLYADVAEPFEEYFEKIVATIMGAVGAQTEVCIVANHDDVVGTFVYPTQPYKVASFYKNLHLLPDPCVFSVEGLEVGVTTVDIIKHLVEAECTAEGVAGGDKIKRAYNHLFHQASFYPLNPPPEEVPLDVDLSNEFGRLSRVPNVMVCPSALNRYVREINRCVCINPGFVDGHSADGSYARLIIHPPDTSVMSSSSSHDGGSQQDNKGSATSSSSCQQQPLPASYIACQIIKT